MRVSFAGCPYVTLTLIASLPVVESHVLVQWNTARRNWISTRELLGPIDGELVQMPASTVLHEIAEYALRGRFVCPIDRPLNRHSLLRLLSNVMKTPVKKCWEPFSLQTESVRTYIQGDKLGCHCRQWITRTGVDIKESVQTVESGQMSIKSIKDSWQAWTKD